MNKKNISIYIVVRIDATYDSNRMDAEEAKEASAIKVIHDAMAHTGTIEDGLQITDITNCGESL